MVGGNRREEVKNRRSATYSDFPAHLDLSVAAQRERERERRERRERERERERERLKWVWSRGHMTNMFFRYIQCAWSQSENEIDVLFLEHLPNCSIVLRRIQSIYIFQDTMLFRTGINHVLKRGSWNRMRTGLTQQWREMETGIQRMRVKMRVNPTIFSSINKTVNKNKKQSINIKK